MRQNIPYGQTQLLDRSAFAIFGATKNAATIPLVYNNAAGVTLRRTGAINATDACDVGIQDLRNLRLQVELKGEEVRGFALLARDVLRPSYGRRYSQAWAGTGFTTTLEIPQSLGSLETLVHSLARFLTENPGKESASSGVTAAIATDLQEDLRALRNAAQGKESDLRTLSKDKQAKFTALRRCLVAQARELKELIPANDLRWPDYGLNIPALKERPATPTNITVVLIGTNALSVKWDKSARAEYYRVWMRIVGAGTEFGVVGSPADLDLLIESLPSNTSFELALSAMNNGGESARSAVVTAQTL